MLFFCTQICSSLINVILGWALKGNYNEELGVDYNMEEVLNRIIYAYYSVLTNLNIYT